MDLDAVDLAGAVVGAVDSTAVLGPDRVCEGDVVVGLVSPNLRSNGFSLIRAVLGDDVVDHADVLLAPSVIYAGAVLEAADRGGLHAAAHITGGGLAANLARALPAGLGARIDTSAWQRPEVFDLVSDRGVPESEMRRTFNLGIGFCLVVEPGAVEDVLAATALHDPRPIGAVTAGPGVELT
jgi:phosphoribosylformylglycinamidine cyclo-ligase